MTVVSSELLIIELKYDCCILSTLDSLVTKLGRRIHCNKPVCLVGKEMDYCIQGHSEALKCQCLSRWYGGYVISQCVLWGEKKEKGLQHLRLQ